MEKVLTRCGDASRRLSERAVAYFLEMMLLGKQTVQEVVDKVGGYVGLGFRHLVFHAPGPDQARFLKLFGEQVAPALRKKFG